MREIKFRVWDGAKSGMVYCNDIMFAYVYPDKDTNTDVYMYTNKSLGTVANWKVCPDKRIFMQYTGLKDKNAKEIYEGDILEWTVKKSWNEDSPPTYTDKTYTQLVEWDDDEAMFLPNDINKEPLVEVIGNVYENPELLK